MGSVFSLPLGTAIFCWYLRTPCPFCDFHQHFSFSPILLAPPLPSRLLVAQLVRPFCLFSISHPLFSRDALKLLVFLLLSASLSIWANCFGQSIQVGVSYFFSLLPLSSSHCPSLPSLHLFYFGRWRWGEANDRESQTRSGKESDQELKQIRG